MIDSSNVFINNLICLFIFRMSESDSGNGGGVRKRTGSSGDGERKRGLCDYQFHTTEEHFDTPKEQIGVGAIWGGLKAHTTSHGIPHVDNARGTLWLELGSIGVRCVYEEFFFSFSFLGGFGV